MTTKMPPGKLKVERRHKSWDDYYDKLDKIEKFNKSPRGRVNEFVADAGSPIAAIMQRSPKPVLKTLEKYGFGKKTKDLPKRAAVERRMKRAKEARRAKSGVAIERQPQRLQGGPAQRGF